MMPMLFVILIVLVSYSITTSGFSHALKYLFSFKLDQISHKTVIDALGHALFSLAIGAGCMLVYGSYLPEKTKIANISLITVLLNIMVALLSGLAIFPIVFTYNLTPDYGPGLMFQVLPVAFSKMSSGSVLATMYFLLLVFAAITSTISLAEPLIILLTQRVKIRRTVAAIMVGTVSWLLGILSVLSFNVLKDIRIYQNKDIFSSITDLSTNILLPIGTLGFTIFAGWIVKKSDIQSILFNDKKNEKSELLLIIIKYITPAAVIISILFSTIL